MVGDEGGVPGQENQVAGSDVRTWASNALSTISPVLVAFVNEAFDACDELVDDLLISTRSEDSWAGIRVLGINLGLEEPMHLVNLISISSNDAMLLAEAVEDGLALVFLRSISLDQGWEGATYGGVGAGGFNCGPIFKADADVFVLDAFEGEEIADSLSASLKIKVDKFGFSTSFGHRVCLCD